MRNKFIPIKISAVFILLSIFICGGNSYSYAEQETLKINFIDVGEGDSIFIQTPQNHAILIDAGNLITGFKVVKYLKNIGISNIDYLFFTHPHLDHIGGAFFIFQMFNVNQVYDNGQDIDELIKSCKSYYWYNELVRKNKKYSQIKAGSSLNIDGVNLDILWPPQNNQSDNSLNYNSMVILLTYKNFKCLFTADINKTVEKNILNQFNNSKIDVLKVGHHGSSDATQPEFLKIVNPKIAIISVGGNNENHYPSTETIDRLKELNIKTYRTDINGNIVLEINTKGEIKATKKDA